MLQDRIIHDGCAYLHSDYDRDLPLLAEKEEADRLVNADGRGPPDQGARRDHARFERPHRRGSLPGPRYRRGSTPPPRGHRPQGEEMDNIAASPDGGQPEPGSYILQKPGVAIEPTSDEAGGGPGTASTETEDSSLNPTFR